MLVFYGFGFAGQCGIDFAEEDVLPLVDPVRHLLDKLESLINV